MTLIIELYRKVWAMWMNLLLEWLLSNIQLPLIGQNLKFMSYYIRLGLKKFIYLYLILSFNESDLKKMIEYLFYTYWSYNIEL